MSSEIAIEVEGLLKRPRFSESPGGRVGSTSPALSGGRESAECAMGRWRL